MVYASGYAESRALEDPGQLPDGKPHAVPNLDPPERGPAAHDRAPAAASRVPAPVRGLAPGVSRAAREPAVALAARDPLRGGGGAGERGSPEHGPRERPDVCRLAALACERQSRGGPRAPWRISRADGEGVLGLAALFDLLNRSAGFPSRRVHRAGMALCSSRMALTSSDEQRPLADPGPSCGATGSLQSSSDRVLPEAVFRPLRSAGTWVAVLAMPRQRRHSRDYLRVALGREPTLGDVHLTFPRSLRGPDASPEGGRTGWRTFASLSPGRRTSAR